MIDRQIRKIPVLAEGGGELPTARLAGHHAQHVLQQQVQQAGKHTAVNNVMMQMCRETAETSTPSCAPPWPSCPACAAATSTDKPAQRCQQSEADMPMLGEGQLPAARLSSHHAQHVLQTLVDTNASVGHVGWGPAGIDRNLCGMFSCSRATSLASLTRCATKSYATQVR
jgi:hypothetical protein